MALAGTSTFLNPYMAPAAHRPAVRLWLLVGVGSFFFYFERTLRACYLGRSNSPFLSDGVNLGYTDRRSSRGELFGAQLSLLYSFQTDGKKKERALAFFFLFARVR